MMDIIGFCSASMEELHNGMKQTWWMSRTYNKERFSIFSITALL